MFIKTSIRKIKWIDYTTEYLVEAYRDPKTKKPKQRTLLCLTKLPDKQKLALKESLKNITKIQTSTLESLKVIATKQYWTVKIMWDIFDKSFDTILSSIPSFSVQHKKALKTIVLNKIFSCKSKYSLPNWINTQDFDFSISNKNDFYECLDSLESNQDTIEKKLLEKTKIEKADIILYDITSTYFEWVGATNLCKYWYSRDHRSDRVQVNIWLITDKTGLPISVEIFEWNIVDKSTIEGKLKDLKDKFNIEDITFVFDRWMKSKANLEAIQEAWYWYITALSHSELKSKALENNEIQLSIFDKKDLAEFIEKDEKTKKEKKLILCHNPSKAKRDKLDRIKLIEKTEKELIKIENLKKDYTDIQLQDKVSKKINRFKCEKYINYEIKNNKLEFSRHQEKIDTDEKFDWFYMIETTETNLKAIDWESKYKSLQLVERAFDSIKNLIEIRPVFHYKETRIKWHIFSCFMSYYILHIFKEKVKELLKDNTLDILLTELQGIQKTYFQIDSKYNFEKLNELSSVQKAIFDIFRVNYTL